MIAAVATASLSLAGLGLAANPAAADTVDAVEDDCGRLSGATRYGTAGTIGSAYDDQSPTDTVIIANGFNYPDALAASGLGRELNAPVMLVEPPARGDNVPLETATGLQSVGAENIVIVGGTAAVGPNAEATLDAQYDVTRIAGDDRFETARDIALEIEEVGQFEGNNTAIITTGRNYPDALAAGPIAYHGDGDNPFPILLTDGATIPAATQQALEAHDIEQVIVVGGSAVVPDSVVAQLGDDTGNEPIVLAGTTREGTAQRVAEFAVEDLEFDLDAVLLADGRVHFPSPDALAGGPLGGLVEAPVLLVNLDENTFGMPAETEAFLTEHADMITQVVALGGTDAIPVDVLNDGCEAAGVPIDGEQPVPTNQTFAVTPAELAVNVPGDARTYTVDVLDTGAESVTIALAESGLIEIDADGNVIFTADATNDDEADFGSAAPAEITVINGVAQTAGTVIQTVDVSTDGIVTFSIVAQDYADVRPVIFVGDEDDANVLVIDGDGMPVGDFGIGGQKVWAEINDLILDPMDATNRYGTQHAQSATLAYDDGTDVNPVPLAGEDVDFYVYTPAAGVCDITDPEDLTVGRTVTTGTVTTDATGTATFVYDSPAAPAATPPAVPADTVHCIYVEWTADEDSDRDGEAASATTTKTWSAAPAAAQSIEAAPDEPAWNNVGTARTVTATIEDQYGEGPANVPVRFEVHRTTDGTTSNIVDSFTRNTNADGVATLTYAGPNSTATDIVRVCTGTGIVGGVCADPAGNALSDDAAPKHWVQNATTQQATDDDIVTADTTADTIIVTPNDAQFWRFAYSTGDTFQINGVTTNYAGFEAQLSVAAAGDYAGWSLTTTGYGDPNTQTVFNLHN